MAPKSKIAESRKRKKISKAGRERLKFTKIDGNGEINRRRKGVRTRYQKLITQSFRLPAAVDAVNLGNQA